MKFDWITWGIWAIGLIILIVWIVVPARELKQLIRSRRKPEKGRHPENDDTSTNPGSG